MPFREAYEIVGRRVREAEAAGATLAALGPGGGITAADLRALDLGRVLGRRNALGGTAPLRVAAAARAARKRLGR